MTYVIEDDEEGLYLAAPLSEEALEKILIEMLFALPVQSDRFYFVPNPGMRFCLDLRKKDINWFRNRQMKKHLKDFDLVVTHNLEESLKIAKDYHVEFHDSTWLSDSFIKQLHQLSLKSANSTSSGNSSGSSKQATDKNLRLYCFQLVEKSTNKVAAMTFGFASGGFYEDYTMCTLIRDDRSCGNILSKLVGFVLQQIGIAVWYWGYQVSYMTDYIDHYGGCNMPRKEFYKIFDQHRHVQLKSFSEVTFPDNSISLHHA